MQLTMALQAVQTNLHMQTCPVCNRGNGMLVRNKLGYAVSCSRCSGSTYFHTSDNEAVEAWNRKVNDD